MAVLFTTERSSCTSKRNHEHQFHENIFSNIFKLACLTFVSKVLPKNRKKKTLAGSLNLNQITPLDQTFLDVIVTCLVSVSVCLVCLFWYVLLIMFFTLSVWLFGKNKGFRKEHDVSSLISKCPSHRISLFMSLFDCSLLETVCQIEFLLSGINQAEKQCRKLGSVPNPHMQYLWVSCNKLLFLCVCKLMLS